MSDIEGMKRNHQRLLSVHGAMIVLTVRLKPLNREGIGILLTEGTTINRREQHRDKERIKRGFGENETHKWWAAIEKSDQNRKIGAKKGLLTVPFGHE